MNRLHKHDFPTPTWPRSFSVPDSPITDMLNCFISLLPLPGFPGRNRDVNGRGDANGNPQESVGIEEPTVIIGAWSGHQILVSQIFFNVHTRNYNQRQQIFRKQITDLTKRRRKTKGKGKCSQFEMQMLI